MALARKREQVSPITDAGELLEILAVLRMKLPQAYGDWIRSAEEHVLEHPINDSLLKFYAVAVPLFEQRERAGRSLISRRSVDLIFLAILIPLFLPIGLLCALLIKLTSPGPVIYKQLRLGKNGVPFWIYKFRTMYVGAERHKPKGIPMFKFEDDPRVTPVGRFLRRRKFDEIPQFLNVLKGDMSLVGPRPLSLSDSLVIRSKYFPRFAVNPGMTGLWQVRRPFTNNPELKLALDCLYVRNSSFWLDTILLLTTLPVLIQGEHPQKERKKGLPASQR